MHVDVWMAVTALGPAPPGAYERGRGGPPTCLCRCRAGLAAGGPCRRLAIRKLSRGRQSEGAVVVAGRSLLDLCLNQRQRHGSGMIRISDALMPGPAAWVPRNDPASEGDRDGPAGQRRRRRGDQPSSGAPSSRSRPDGGSPAAAATTSSRLALAALSSATTEDAGSKPPSAWRLSRVAWASLGLGNARQHLLDVLAAAGPTRQAAGLAGH